MAVIRSFLLMAAILGGPFITPCLAQGVIPIALQQSVNQNGQPLAGCLLYIFQAGTVATPQNAFSDAGLTLPLSNPLVCDQNGRLPMFYLASGSVHVRLTDASGIVQFDYPSMLVIGAAGGGGGGGGTVDPTAIASVGDTKFRPTSESLTGWVKLNGQSIGTSTSGGTGRANADTQTLYVYLWNNCSDAHCPVNGAAGNRGATGLADFNANKPLTLPDWRSRTPLGLADMGSTSCSGVRADCLTSANITSGGGDSVTTPGATGGESNHLLSQAQIPNVTWPNSLGATIGTLNATLGSLALVGSISGNSQVLGVDTPVTPGAGNLFQSIVSGTVRGNGQSFNIVGAPGISGSPGLTGGVTSGGGGSAFNNLSPFALGTWHMKL